MTEIGMALTNPLEESNRRPGWVGKPFPGVRSRIVDKNGENCQNGELQIKGQNVFQGYFEKEEATSKEFTPDGWFKTGDTAEVDGEGFYRILGRSSVDIIK